MKIDDITLVTEVIEQHGCRSKCCMSTKIDCNRWREPPDLILIPRLHDVRCLSEIIFHCNVQHQFIGQESIEWTNSGWVACKYFIGERVDLIDLHVRCGYVVMFLGV